MPLTLAFRLRLLALLVAGMALAAPAPASERGLLWRVEGAAGPPSHLFGTIHSEDPRVARLAEPVRRALDQSRHFVMEVVLDEIDLLAVAGATALPPGQSLRTLLGDTLFRRAADALALRGYPEAAVDRLKPWMVIVTVSSPRLSTGQILDLVLLERARARGIPVSGLESMEEQLNLVDDLPLEEQIAALRDTLENLEAIETSFEEMHAAYLQRDLSALVALNERYQQLGDSEIGEKFMRRLIDERNERMAARLQARLERGGVFVAVGALHLPGREGLIELLRRRGYRVSAVY